MQCSFSHISCKLGRSKVLQDKTLSHLVDIHCIVDRLPFLPGAICCLQDKGKEGSQHSCIRLPEKQLWCAHLKRPALSLDGPYKAGDQVESLEEEPKTAEDNGGEDLVFPPPKDRGDNDEEGQQEAGDEFSCGVVGRLPWSKAWYCYLLFFTY